MKKWLRNLALGTLIAGAGAGYVAKEYNDYKIPEELNLEVMGGGSIVGTYRAKSNPVFKSIDSLLGIERAQSHTKTGLFNSKSVALYVNYSEDGAKEVVRNWRDYEKNAKISKGDKSWKASKQIVYNFMKSKKESDFEKEYFDEMFGMTKAHEMDHLDKLSRKIKYSKEDYEISAMLKAMEIHPAFALSDAMRAYEEEIPVYKGAAEKIINELVKYPDTPDVYTLCHDPYMEVKVSKRSKEIKERLFKK